MRIKQSAAETQGIGGISESRGVPCLQGATVDRRPSGIGVGRRQGCRSRPGSDECVRSAHDSTQRDIPSPCCRRNHQTRCIVVDNGEVDGLKTQTGVGDATSEINGVASKGEDAGVCGEIDSGEGGVGGNIVEERRCAGIGELKLTSGWRNHPPNPVGGRIPIGGGGSGTPSECGRPSRLQRANERYDHTGASGGEQKIQTF